MRRVLVVLAVLACHWLCQCVRLPGLQAAEPRPSAAQSSTAASEEKKKPNLASPQEAFAAFQKAVHHKDWGAATSACATRLQDHLVRSNIALGYRIASGVTEHKPAFEEMLRRHVTGLDQLKQQTIADAKQAGHDPLAADLAARLLPAVKDKPALLAELLPWIARLGIDHGLAASAVEGAQLKDLKINGDEATAIAVSGVEDDIDEFPIKFVRESDGWRILLPEL